MGRSGLGAWLEPASTPNAEAIWGNKAARRSTVLVSSAGTVSGFEVMETWVRMGVKAAASRTATQRSANASAVRLAVAASAKRRPRSTGKIAPALGGCPASFNARTMRPTPRLASMSASQFWYSSSVRVTKPAFISAMRSRHASERSITASFAEATMLRRSRRSS